ncbi:MucR family transcriptional regulator [Rhodomicrobium sp. Az07]|uniref:MucR family transcriptional regulator n=1 Tax=Rhodomicrobium sp. Az07 TaxID=2839034 RepID=UPI001BE6D6C2|nr:MucR family transcriptional regulator [Rhodomicrobium sp. Az07]MBT3071555.1 MucR family transcriptional regulator [Rhodomicrobium sp. Az07]
MENSNEIELTSFTADVVAAYVANNVISADKLADFIGSVYAALSKAATQTAEPAKPELTPAVPIKKSVTQDHIICLEDGKKFKSLKRHLKTHYDLSPEEYREKWGLPHDYPMVAPAYAQARSNLAKSMGLGQRNGAKAGAKPASAPPAPKAAAPKARGRRPRNAA